MRSITRNLFRILNNEKLLPVQFLDLQLVGATASSTIRITDYGEPIRWAGHDYIAVSMSRGGIEEILSSESGESPESTLNISNIDAGMAQILSAADLNGALATLWVADRRLLARQRDAMVLAQGEVRDPQLSGTVLTFQVVNVIGLMDRLTVPRRLWQAECNYTFGSAACGVNLAKKPYGIEAVVQDGSQRNALIVSNSVLSDAGNPTDLEDFWANGYLLFETGAAATQARPIGTIDPVNGDQVRFYVRYPFFAIPATGDKVVIRRGCRKNKTDCKARRNLNNFGGFPDVPPLKFKPVEREDPR
jgi:phage-related protein